jgi:MFS family permease
VYRLDWLEQLKLRLTASPSARMLTKVSPVVWALGFTSLLTDVATEMVNSVLPLYLVLHRHMSPLQYGIIDGLYNGFAIALLSLTAGLLADRWQRQKEVAAVGYGLSAICKLALLFTAAWGWIALIVGLDRAGKGMRAAPRDALISLNTPAPAMATAFAVHRGLDAGGALFGPLLAFAILSMFPASFDIMWATSFVFAIFGISVLWLMVPPWRGPTLPAAPVAPLPTPTPAPSSAGPSLRSSLALCAAPRFRTLLLCALLLALTTVSDGFLYLMLQKRNDTPANMLPLFYVGTASFYMLFSLPVGLLADRWGRTRVLIAGFAVLPLIYLGLMAGPFFGVFDVALVLAMMGLYYAATEGLLIAMGAALVAPEVRTSGLALVGTAIGIGKMGSSVLFGAIWGAGGSDAAMLTFCVAMVVVLLFSARRLRGITSGISHV